MSTQRRYFVACVVSLMTISAIAQTTLEKSSAETTARALVEAMSASDGPRIRGLFAPNASQAYGSGKAKSGPDFFAWLQSDIIDSKGKVDGAKFVANGSEVVITGNFSNSRGYRSAANFLLVVQDAKIVSWRMRY